MKDCIFCRTASGEIPANRVYETENILDFPDIHPKAPVHILIIQKIHYATTIELSERARSSAGSCSGHQRKSPGS